MNTLNMFKFKLSRMRLWIRFCCWLGVILVVRYQLSRLSGSDTWKEDLIETVVSSIWAILSALVLLFNFTRLYIHENNTVIKREWLLLKALATDFKKAHESVDKINENANQVWESGMLNLRDVTQKLTVAETEWVRDTGDLSFEAKRCAEDVQEGDLQEYSDLDYMRLILGMVRNGIPREITLAFGMRRAKRAMRTYWEENERGRSAKELVRLLEDTRVRVRILQERPIDKSSNQYSQARNIRSSQPFQSAQVLVLQRLVSSEHRFMSGMETQIHEMVVQLQLLRALVKDLRAVTLETEIEKEWLGEANEVVGQVQKEINAFLNEVAYRVWWLSRVTDYLLYRPKFKKVMSNVTLTLTHLREMKERYGFNFIKRGLSEVSLIRLDDCNGDIAIRTISETKSSIQSALLEKELEQKPNDCPQSVYLVLKELKDLEKRLTEEEQTDGGTHTRVVCFNLLSRMFCNLENCVKNSRWDEVERIKESAALLTTCMQVYRIKGMQESSAVVGLEEAKHELVSKLTSGDADRQLPVISIVGMRGIGKTTLAKEICNHKLIVENFASRRLVTLPEEISVDELTLLQRIGKQVFPQLGKEMTNDISFWIRRLEVSLRAKKYLIVLDNLSKTEVWDFLKPVLIPAGTISTVVITTQNKEVAFHTNSPSIHYLRLRTVEESLALFLQMVDQPTDTEVKKLAMKVVERTGGLPLAILRLGYLLSGKTVTRVDLSALLERVWQGENRSPWEANWETNKQDLRPQSVLENCLSHFLLFPIDYRIPRRRIIAMWISQGLIPVHNPYSQSESELVEKEKNLADQCLSDLLNRNMIQIVERKPNGKVHTCQFPGILRDIWLARPSNNDMAHPRIFPRNRKQVAYCFGSNQDGSYSRVICSISRNALEEGNYPLSVTLFDTREGNQPGKDVHSFLTREISSGNFLGLLVLDLERVFKPHLPEKIGALDQLKYLGLRWTDVETLPLSIGKLSNLQTLDLKKTSLRTLPSSVWKLKKLRHLHLNQCRIEAIPAQIEISMKNLRKLTGVFIDDRSKALMDSLDKLSNLRKLTLTFQLTGLNQEKVARNIQKLTNLRSLSLRSVNERCEPQDLKLEDLSSLKNLSSLYLFGMLENFSVISELPQSLTELTLSSSELSQGSLILEVLSALKELKYLSFLSSSYIDKELVLSPGGFPKLLHLKLWKLETLERLVIQENALPELREFEIRNCTKLATTSCFTHIRSLQLLKLTHMSQDYVKYIEEKFKRAKRQNPERIFPAITETSP